MVEFDKEISTPFEVIQGDRTSGFLLICDHARPHLPKEYDHLGLPQSEMERHIAYDIGVRDVTIDLARELGVPAVLSTFSRLLIDPNRGEDDPTLVMRVSDGALIPGNAFIDQDEINERKNNFYRPYHQAIEEELLSIEREKAGFSAVIISIHSFTPVWRGVQRPWHAAILWDSDPRLAVPILKQLREDQTLMVGDNEPYDGALLNDCMYRHGTRQGRAHALVELRQDLIVTPEGVQQWVKRLAGSLKCQQKNQELFEQRFFPSRALAKQVEKTP